MIEPHKHEGNQTPKIESKDLLPYTIIGTAPSDSPIEGTIRLYDNGSVQRVYLKLNNQWQYIGLGALYGRYVTSTTGDEPSVSTNEIMLWKDSTLTKYYLKANFNGTSKKVELT